MRHPTALARAHLLHHACCASVVAAVATLAACGTPPDEEEPSSGVTESPLWLPNQCPAVAVPNTAGLMSSSTGGHFQTLTCTAGTFPSGATTQQFVCIHLSRQWLPNPASTGCTMPCPAVAVPNTFGLMSSSTGGNIQSLVCPTGTFPSGATTQQFTCNGITGQWGPNPASTPCTTPCPAVAVPNTFGLMSSSTGGNLQHLTCAGGTTFPSGANTQPFTCNGITGQWGPNPASTSCLARCPAVAVTNTAGLMSSSTGGDFQTLSCNAGTFPSGAPTQQFVCDGSTGQWDPNPASTSCLTPCPAVAVPNTAGLMSSSTGGSAQTLTCTVGAFPSGAPTQQFTCNTSTGQWGPNPGTMACQ